MAVVHARKPLVVLQGRRVAQAERPPVARLKVSHPDRAAPELAVQQTAEPLVDLPVQWGE